MGVEGFLFLSVTDSYTPAVPIHPAGLLDLAIRRSLDRRVESIADVEARVVPEQAIANLDNATRAEADIDLYVSTDPGLTNLDVTALTAAGFMSVGISSLLVIPAAKRKLAQRRAMKQMLKQAAAIHAAKAKVDSHDAANH